MVRRRWNSSWAGCWNRKGKERELWIEEGQDSSIGRNEHGVRGAKEETNT